MITLLLSTAAFANPALCHARAHLLDDAGAPLTLFLSYSADPTTDGALDLASPASAYGAVVSGDQRWVAVKAVVQGTVTARIDEWTVERDGDALRVEMDVGPNHLELWLVPSVVDLTVEGTWERGGVLAPVSGSGTNSCSEKT